MPTPSDEPTFPFVEKTTGTDPSVIGGDTYFAESPDVDEEALHDWLIDNGNGIY